MKRYIISSFVVVAFLFVCSDALANIVQNEFDCYCVVNIEFSFVVFLGEINNLLASRPLRGDFVQTKDMGFNL